MIRNRFKEAAFDPLTGCSDTFNCKGGGGDSTTTTKPSPAQEAILNKQLGLAESLEQQGELQFFDQPTLAGESPLIGQAQQQALQGGQQFAGLGQGILGAAERGLGADLVSDPRTEALAQAVTRPLEQQFREQTLPGISSAAVSQGAFGGDRADILRSQAARDFATSVGDTRAQVFSDANRAGLAQQQAILGLLPNVQQGILAPAEITGQVGAQQQGRTQQEIDAERERFEFEQFAGTDLANRVGGLLAPLNFGSVTTTKGGGGK